MSYENLRHLADSWGLVYLFALFFGAILYAFRPGGKKAAQEAAQIPFKDD